MIAKKNLLDEFKCAQQQKWWCELILSFWPRYIFLE